MARPFITHHNALDINLYLRIAPELYLKRLIVGGLDRVYEINRNFRNEGISTQHNPEFTMLEFYQAYADYHDMIAITERLLRRVAEAVLGSVEFDYGGQRISFAKFEQLTMKEAVLRYWPSQEIEKLTLPQVEELTLAQLDDHQAMANRVPGLNQWLQQRGVAPIPPQAVLDKRSGELLALFFELVAEEHLIQPTFIVDYPLEVSPLSKQKPDNPNFVERFELYIGGMEIANAFSELNDPEEQRNRFQYQQNLREKGDLTAHAIDEDYIRALSYGMPPTGGEGIGVDRLTMLLTDSRSIRDVILFPLLRPEKRSE